MLVCYNTIIFPEQVSHPLNHQLTLSGNRVMLQTIVIQKVTCKGN